MSGKFILLDCPIFNCIVFSDNKSEFITQNLVVILFSKGQIKNALDSSKLYNWLKKIHDPEEYITRTRLEYDVKLINDIYRVIFEVSNDRININPYLDKIKSFLINELANGSGINGFKTEIINGFYLTFMI